MQTVRCNVPLGIGRKLVMLGWVWLAAAQAAFGQAPPAHFWHPIGMPPGAIGGQQLQRGGPLQGFFQPVEIKAPQGALISLAEEGRFGQAQPGPVRAGLLVGAVYRLCVFNLPFQPGVEVFPTIELIDRLYAPAGQETRFPIVIDLAREDLELAAAGKYVTRVIYVEDPNHALPARHDPNEPNWFDVAPGMDPLVVADTLGRPVAIVRLGGRVPDRHGAPDAGFLFGCPPVHKYPARTGASSRSGNSTTPSASASRPSEGETPGAKPARPTTKVPSPSEVPPR